MIAALRHPSVTPLAILIAVGGSAVLATYVWGLAQPAVAAGLWGGVPDGLRPLYTVSMFTAAAGFFPMTHYLLVRLDPDRTRIGGASYHVLLGGYAAMLLGSALWLPLTAAMLASPTLLGWWMVRGVLFLVAAGSLGLLWAVTAATPQRPGRSFAIVGTVAFCFQTVVLDALVWPWYFPR